ncbi:hypothetical protein SAMN05444288_2235 [Hoylesella oralis]|nr:hypothetical protein HMPREF1199_00264 [Hoylesella oralis CC98A]SHG04897.1 hypothetical protein SAMN05444288_2235 [Hoylesella oralis]
MFILCKDKKFILVCQIFYCINKLVLTFTGYMFTKTSYIKYFKQQRCTIKAKEMGYLNINLLLFIYHGR